jgi:hypothetical protein
MDGCKNLFISFIKRMQHKCYEASRLLYGCCDDFNTTFRWETCAIMKCFFSLIGQNIVKRLHYTPNASSNMMLRHEKFCEANFHWLQWLQHSKPFAGLGFSLNLLLNSTCPPSPRQRSAEWPQHVRSFICRTRSARRGSHSGLYDGDAV